ncbi:MAG: IS1595 family transposase [Rhodospirillales bacterium]|nr:IS1595 family transposase [Rhodospirillales bacterium]
MANELNNKIFQDETKAREWLEGHLWPAGPICPFCGTIDAATAVANRNGLYQCNVKECRKQFTVTVGTLFERSHIPLNKWLMAAFLICASKKGVSAHQVHRMIGVSYKSTWFMMHRLREAMRTGGLAPMGGNGGTVEVDETFIGHDKTKKPRGSRKGRGYHHKYKVLTLVSRTGEARSFHVQDLSAKALVPILQANIARETKVKTDEAGQYHHLKKFFAEHHVLRHNVGEYGRGEAHTNTIEGFFSIFKRGMKGVYQHCGEQHLHRYLAEFDFRYNNRTALNVTDAERAAKALKGIVGKRLTYRRTNEADHA